MRARAAASRATRLLESVALATFSDIDQNPDLLRRPDLPFPPPLAMRMAPPCAVRWRPGDHRHLQGAPGSSCKAACKVIRGSVQSASHRSALTASPLRRHAVSALL